MGNETFGIGQMAASAGINAGMGIVNNVAQLAFGKHFQKQALEGQRKSLEQQNAAQYDMWQKTNYPAQMEQLKKAGLNPGLLYGMSGGGSATTGSASGNVGGTGSPQNVMDMGSIAQIRLMEAQARKLEAETKDIEGSAANRPKQGENLDADTANKVLNGIILKYGGKEAEAQWMINDNLRTEEYGAKADEYNARMATATNIVRLYEDGTMKKMSDAELENKLKDIGLKNVQIKGKEIENAIQDLERQLQEKFGIDKSSPVWLKMAGRLLLGLIGGK